MRSQQIIEKMDQDRLSRLTNSLFQSVNGKLAGWDCTAIGPGNGNFVTGGVYRISGIMEAEDGTQRSWSFVLKVVNADPKRNDPAHYNYWRREIMAYDSGYLQSLPAILRVPTCYAIEEQDDGSVWMWLEDVGQESRRWEKRDYEHAADKLGEFQAGYLVGQPLPDLQWINRQWMRSWLRECYVFRYVPDDRQKELFLADSRVAAILDKFNRLEKSADDWLTALERLPRTFAHQDFYEQNMILQPNGPSEGPLILFDWQFASISGIGEDLGRFLGLAISRGQVPVEAFDTYRELLFSSYLQGMRRAGWEGDESLPRFGYLAAFALRSIWEVPKMLQQLEQEPDSPKTKKMMLIAERQMEAMAEVEHLLLNVRRLIQSPAFEVW